MHQNSMCVKIVVGARTSRHSQHFRGSLRLLLKRFYDGGEPRFTEWRVIFSTKCFDILRSHVRTYLNGLATLELAGATLPTSD